MKKSYTKWIIGASAAGAGLVLLDSILLEKYFFETRHYDIGNKKAKDKVRLVLITDLHFRHKMWPQYEKLAKEINRQEPDLIMITGDTLDSDGDISPAKRFLSLLRKGIPKVAIPGNHDHKADRSLQELRKAYEQHQCDFLINESKAYQLKGHRFMLTGLDDFIEGDGRFAKAVEKVGYEEHHLLLVHSPLQQEVAKRKMDHLNEMREEEKRLNISYAFAGHNHGGQVRLLNFVPVLPVKSGDYVNGWYNKEKPFLYVSKGFGTSTLPLRFMARSELTVFDYYL